MRSATITLLSATLAAVALLGCEHPAPAVPFLDVAAENLSIVDGHGRRVAELSVADRSMGEKRNDFWLFDSSGTPSAHIAQHGDCSLELESEASSNLKQIRLWASSTMPAVDVAVTGNIHDYDLPRTRVARPEIHDTDALARIDYLLRDPEGSIFASIGASREGAPCIVFVTQRRTVQATACAGREWDLQLYRENTVMARAELGSNGPARLILIDGNGKTQAVNPPDGRLVPFETTGGRLPLNQPAAPPDLPIRLRDSRGNYVWQRGAL
jgi:hypothetical protein